MTSAQDNPEVAVGQETLAMKLALENGVEWRTLNDEAKQAWRRYAKATVDGRNQREMKHTNKAGKG